MASSQGSLKIFQILQNPIPQYVLGSLPAILTIGATPHKTLLAKFLWFVRCLDGSRDDEDRENDNKINEESSENSTNNKIIDVEKQDFPRPFGHHAMKIKPNKSQNRILKDWVSEASLLDRLLLIVSAYYIILGIAAGISKAAGPCTNDTSLQDWPYIPILFIWTLPVIFVRIRSGKVVNKVLPKRLKSRITIVRYNTANVKTNRNWTFIIFCVSFFLPWLTVIIAYWTPPVGFYCRSKFLTIICSIWSISSIAAYISHIKGEKDVHGPISIVFSFFGAVIGGGMIFLSILANNNSLWITLFSDNCYVPPPNC
ncbi:2367_t:CDS:2 [Dentiscutata erythropus]|uniref:2367_t:CDS:1 n=1 Tax=Dentiscutata erythropus TaxID=1348616 RepID=A0A9N9NPY5_9GLOM|nr:2367_t:CDS:2 [Dentiscutata erythropus]